MFEKSRSNDSVNQMKSSKIVFYGLTLNSIATSIFRIWAVEYNIVDAMWSVWGFASIQSIYVNSVYCVFGRHLAKSSLTFIKLHSKFNWFLCKQLQSLIRTHALSHSLTLWCLLTRLISLQLATSVCWLFCLASCSADYSSLFPCI